MMGVNILSACTNWLPKAVNVPRIVHCFRNPILCEVICFHVDDMLGTGDEQFELKMNELDQLVGFGSMKGQKFVHSGRQYEKYGNDKITISMKSYIQNLTKSKSDARAHETVG